MRLLPRFVAPAFMMALAALPILANLTGCQTAPATTATVLPPDELPDLNRAGLESIWQRQLSLSAGERIRRVWRVGASVYVASSDARLIRIDAKTGAVKWMQGLGAENFNIYKPIELKSPSGGTSQEVLVVTGGEVFTFDLETGDHVKAPARLGLSVSADPLVIGNTLCVAGAGTFYGLYLDRPDLRRWVLPARGDLFVSTPVALDGNVMVASRSGQLWRISGDTGEWDWKDRKTNGNVVAGLAADFNALYVPSLDQRVYAFRTDTGGQLWETQLSGRLEDTPVLAGPILVVKSQTSGIYGLARTNGAIKWQAEDVTQIATGLENEVWVLGSGQIKALDVNDGDVIASAPATGIQMAVRNTVDKNVILVTNGGRIGVYSSGRAAAAPKLSITLDTPAEPATTPAP